MKNIIITLLFVFVCTLGNGQDNSFGKNHPNLHKIIVNDVLQTTSYTYIQADENGKLQWLAVPKMEAVKGQTYYYKGGAEMRDFKSTELKRTFQSVLFLEGVINPIANENGKTVLEKSPEFVPAVQLDPNLKITPDKDGISIAELFNKKKKYNGKTVKIKGQVTKYNESIMGKNWIHLYDGSIESSTFDLTATSKNKTKLGDIITIKGTVVLDKDFGAGYFFNIIVEDCEIIND